MATSVILHCTIRASFHKLLGLTSTRRIFRHGCSTLNEKTAKVLSQKLELEKEDKTGVKFEARAPKGTRDFNHEQVMIREEMFKVITDCFKRHGAETMDTPIFELKDVLNCEYGEGEKKIFELVTQGAESYALRYDLTVPFARFLAMNKIKRMKRYQIGKVYRRDNPSRGRYREFYQCDFDFAGEHSPMIPDAECVRMIDEILTNLKLGKFIVKLNHRLLLDGIFEVCGVSPDKFRSVCTTVDKLDKCQWEEVRTELIIEKGLSAESADAIGRYIRLTGGRNVIDELRRDNQLMNVKMACNGVEALELLMKYCQLFGVDEEKLKIDMSLARGLDYYTGFICEGVLDSKEHNSEPTLSIAGGGRYDNLVGMFDSKWHVPCVGFSIGVERIVSILESRKRTEECNRTKHVDVYIATPQKRFMEERMKLVSALWNSGIKAEMSYKENPKLLTQLQHCEEYGIPLVVIIGQSELEKGVVKIRDVMSRKEVEVKRDDLITEIVGRLTKIVIS